MTYTNTTIIQGIVGSTAYGLAREGSDVDRLGVYVSPTIEIAGLDWHSSRESVVTKGPDMQAHEIGKYLRLALGCNPTLLELMWLPATSYEIMTEEGSALRELAPAFPSEHRVRGAYGGYAKEQAERLMGRGGTFDSNLKGRTAKHGRHMLRLLRQGKHLLETGEIKIKVDDPEEYWAFDNYSPEQMYDIFIREEKKLQATKSVLPKEPDRQAVKDYLQDIRIKFLQGDK